MLKKVLITFSITLVSLTYYSFNFYFSGSRETAFISAISAAGVVVAVGRACKRDDVTMCGCGDDIRPNNLNARWVRLVEIFSE